MFVSGTKCLIDIANADGSSSHFFSCSVILNIVWIWFCLFVCVCLCVFVCCYCCYYCYCCCCYCYYCSLIWFDLKCLFYFSYFLFLVFVNVWSFFMSIQYVDNMHVFIKISLWSINQFLFPIDAVERYLIFKLIMVIFVTFVGGFVLFLCSFVR